MDRRILTPAGVALAITGLCGTLPRTVGQGPARSTQTQVGYGRRFPGEFLQKTTAHVPYSIVFLNVAQRF